MGGVLDLSSDTMGKVHRFLREDVPYWVTRPNKKPLLQQAREMADLWRAYHLFPYQYFKHDLYLRSVGDGYRHFIPAFVADKSIDDFNPRPFAPWLEDKVQFGARMAEANLPAVTTFAILRIGDGKARARDRNDQAVTFPAFLDLARHEAGGEIFVKPRFGGQGIGAYRLQLTATGLAREGEPLDEAGLVRLLAPHGFDDYLVQPYFEQHPEMRVLNPSSVNTLRVVTLLNRGEVEIVGAALRVGAGRDDTDNWSSGGFIAKVELPSGRVARTARTKLGYSATRELERHPNTGVVFGDIVIPHAAAVEAVVVRGARAFSPIRLIGWDVAIGADGPRVLEGNFLSAFLMLQDACGGLRQTGVGRELAEKYHWR